MGEDGWMEQDGCCIWEKLGRRGGSISTIPPLLRRTRESVGCTAVFQNGESVRDAGTGRIGGSNGDEGRGEVWRGRREGSHSRGIVHSGTRERGPIITFRVYCAPSSSSTPRGSTVFGGLVRCCRGAIDFRHCVNSRNLAVGNSGSLSVLIMPALYIDEPI